jgi:endonuclease YncB( thermonuclease family)
VRTLAHIVAALLFVGVPIGLALLLILLVVDPARGQTTGVVVVDADTIKLNGTTYRLHGIDAPELAQTCDGWIAGEYAAAVLRGLIDKRFVICIPRSTDRYGRTVAICLADGVDVGAEMVRQGLAWSFTRYSTAYADLEAEAKADRLGVHGAHCKTAWEHRSEKR